MAVSIGEALKDAIEQQGSYEERPVMKSVFSCHPTSCTRLTHPQEQASNVDMPFVVFPATGRIYMHKPEPKTAQENTGIVIFDEGYSLANLRAIFNSIGMSGTDIITRDDFVYTMEENDQLRALFMSDFPIGTCLEW